MVINNDDPGPPRSDRPVHLLFRDTGAVPRWVVGSTLCLYLPRYGLVAGMPLRFTQPAVTENDTLARIGTSCLQQLLENNVKKLSTTRWERVTSTFAKLFKTTTPHQLFDDALRVEIDDTGSNIDDTPGKFFEFSNT